MKNRAKRMIIEALLPPEKTFEKIDYKSKNSKDDMMFILGWNHYRQAILDKIKF